MSTANEHLDVLIVGAGLSGIGAACHLERACPQKSYAVLEARGEIGGTWDLFRYPGVRSDSDMHTLGFSFRPWTGEKRLADGASILEYIRATAAERGVAEKIRFGHRAVAASWSSEEARWSVEIELPEGERKTITCGFLFGCTGYYDYDRGHEPELPGAERFAGRIVHPQRWDESVETAGKRIVVIGSGATAVTLVPALAEEAEHVTMLQRSPTYVLSMPQVDTIGERLRGRLPERVAHRLVRWKNLLISMLHFQLSRRWPRAMRRLIRAATAKQLPPGYEVDVHFNPTYNPWEQRLCLVPGGDLFASIRSGRASVVTDRIQTLTEGGIRLDSGQEIPAEVIITATGLKLQALGGMEVEIDGEPLDLASSVTYKGTMLSGVPNAAVALGYTNASWTLKCELICEYVCRLLNHMDARGYDVAMPDPAAAGPPTDPFIDLTSGYVKRKVADFPKQGPRSPWRAEQNYFTDIRLFRHGPVDDDMVFRRLGSRSRETVAG